jgi:N utilization substance protein A
MRGVRIQNIVNELYGEKIDVLPWDADMSKYIANALSPAQVVKVDLDENEKSALVLVPQNQLSLAIGKEGQNARLAAKLTGWRIDIKPVTAGAAVAAANAGYGINHDDDAFARLARAALNREREREVAAEQTLNTSFAKAARAAGIVFGDEDNADSPKEESNVPQGIFQKVRKDGTFTYKGVTLGPLPPHVAEQTVQLVENARGLFVMLGEEMIRGFRRDEFEGGEEEEEETTSEVETTEHERESRKVRKDGMVVFRNQSFGPLGDNFIGQTVEVELNGDHLDVFLEDELLDSFLYQE